MDETKLELYWTEIPVGKENAITYEQLCIIWKKNERAVRRILHELSGYDNGDDYILIRSSHGKGFYKTTDPHDIEAFRKECIGRGKHVFAPVRKIDRVLKTDNQLSFVNNLRAVRTSQNMQQTEVCERMKNVDPSFDVSMLSRMENGRCLPTPLQLAQLAYIYGCTAKDLVNTDLY